MVTLIEAAVTALMAAAQLLCKLESIIIPIFLVFFIAYCGPCCCFSPHPSWLPVDFVDGPIEAVSGAVCE